jgi:hypothetical protein
MANTSWNSADKAAFITLTGSNLIATAGVGTGGMRSIDSNTTGKFYWEVTANTFTNIATCIGIASVTYPLGTTSLWSGGVTGSVALLQGGQIGSEGVNTGLTIGGAVANGTVICVATDIGARQIWFRLGAAGLWNNSGTANPATGVGGVGYTSMGSGVATYPAGSFNASGDRMTANFGDTAFTGAVPAGFTSGFPGAGGTGGGGQAVRVMVLA